MISTKYRHVLLFFIISQLSFTCFAQKVALNPNNFPNSWTGNWEGELKIYTAEGLKQSLPMSLNIQPIAESEHYEWSIIYGPDKEKGKRGYELLPKNPENGVWAIDEKNGIILECYLLGNKLFSSYHVMERNFLVTYEKNGDQLVFEISCGPDQEISSTGGIVEEGKEDIPSVKAYEIGGLQKAILVRVE